MNYENELNKLEELYLSEGYNLYYRCEEQIYFTINIRNERYIIAIVCPPNGNNNHWIMRADPWEHHDRWGNCMWENKMESFEQLLEYHDKWFWNLEYNVF